MNMLFSSHASKMSHVFMIFALMTPCFTSASEYIKRFSSDITISADASMSVVETLEVISAGKQIRRGIVREFPTRYNDYGGTYYRVGFTIQSITLDGHPVPYTIKDEYNGKRIYIGDEHKQLKPGFHRYTIAYTTNRQLGFFKDHDELFWNVTGNGVRFPIETVEATIHLPARITRDMVNVHAYTGYEGSQEQDYTVITHPILKFATTRMLMPYEGLSIVVGWPKGFVLEPSWYMRAWWFFKDNSTVLWLVFWLLVCLGYYGYAWYVAWQRRRPGVIIPLFTPPEECGPSGVGYMTSRGFSNKLVAAELVALAVRGYITIAYEKGTYILTSVYDSEVELTTANAWKEVGEPAHSLLKILFSDAPVVRVQTSQHERFAKVTACIRTYCANKYSTYVTPAQTAVGWIISCMAIIGAGLMDTESINSLAVGLIILIFIALNILATTYLTSYTKDGRLLQDHIDGFALFLQTTEEERLKIIGTPPTKNPELYERYLPYAMALGIEEAWTRQFAPLFEQLQKQGTPYVPLWYAGRWNGFSPVFATSLLSSSLSTAISSASTPPGRSSGFGSGGSSGGGSGRGGGGGGVGGW